MRRARRHLPKPKSKPNRKIAIIAVFGFIVLLLGLIYHFLPSKWDMKSRLIVAIPQENKDVTIAVFDPASHSIMHFMLPATTQVIASRNLGTWKLGSIWELGLQEKVGGQLLTETILKTFQIPVDVWMPPDSLGFLSSNVRNIIKAGIGSATNMTLKDRINVVLFSLRLNPSDKYQIDLIETGYLYEALLTDGEEGFARRKELPAKIASYVSDPHMALKQPRMAIRDASGPTSAASDVSHAVEALGGKVLSIEDEQTSDVDCVIYARDTLSVIRLASLLSCHVTKSTSESNFDVEILIGRAFAKRY